jgi:hypothetical protein
VTTARSWWRRGDNLRADAQAAKDAAAEAFYELDTAQRDLVISIETIGAVDNSPAAQRVRTDFRALVVADQGDGAGDAEERGGGHVVAGDRQAVLEAGEGAAAGVEVGGVLGLPAGPDGDAEGRGDEDREQADDQGPVLARGGTEEDGVRFHAQTPSSSVVGAVVGAGAGAGTVFSSCALSACAPGSSLAVA